MIKEIIIKYSNTKKKTSSKHRGKEQHIFKSSKHLVKTCHAEQVFLLETLLSRIEQWLGVHDFSFIVRRQRTDRYDSQGWRVYLWGICQDIMV